MAVSKCAGPPLATESATSSGYSDFMGRGRLKQEGELGSTAFFAFREFLAN
jgi:hypothetical protein